MNEDSPRRLVDIPSLDGLRALSIAIVFVSHAGFASVPGGLGVSIFFVISGYLITTLLCVEWDRSGAISLRGFYLRRAFRILPLFYAVLALGIVAVGVGLVGDGIDAPALTSQLLHYFNFFAIAHDGYRIVPGTGVYWSLAIEEHFYVVFPFVFLLMGRAGWSRRRQAIALLAACAVVLAWRLVLVHGFAVSENRTYLGSDTRVDGLLFGCAAALVANPAFYASGGPGERRRAPWTSAGLAAAAVITILATLAVRDAAFRETFRYTLQSIAIVVGMRYAIVATGSPVFRLFNAGPVAWFGRLSYGFYLVHQIVIHALEERISGRVPVLVLSLVISTGLTWGLHVVVERPTARLRSRVLSRPSAAATVAGSVAQ
jgi:peptidoglycan/LPS O-acetylase OafA/YrhL